MFMMLLPMDPGVGTTIGGGGVGNGAPRLGGMPIKKATGLICGCASGCASGWTAAASWIAGLGGGGGCTDGAIADGACGECRDAGHQC